MRSVALPDWQTMPRAERDRLLSAYHQEGLSASQIAAKFQSTTRSAVLGFLYLFVFSLGLTALLVAVGLSSGLLAALPAAGRWTVTIKRAGGVLLLLMAEYYFVRMGSVL